MDFEFIGIAIIVIIVISTIILEKNLRTIAQQNNRVIELLEEIKEKE